MLKRAFIICLVLVVIGTGVSVIALPSIVQGRMNAFFSRSGFSDITIAKTSTRPGGATLKEIQLDEEGFSTIERIDLKFNWFLYMLKQQIDSVEIYKIVHNDLSDHIDLNALMESFDLNLMRTVPVRTISIDNAQLNLSTDFGDIRMEAKMLMNTLNDGSKTVQAVTWAKQYQLGFQVPVSGVLRPDGSFLFESTFNEGKLNVGPLRVSRLSGWASLENSRKEEDGKDTTAFSTQLDAGSADILGLPVQDISIALSQSPQNSNGIFRSGISGMPSIAIAADWNHAGESVTGNITVELGAKEDILALIKQLQPDFDTTRLKALGKQSLLLTLQYLPERRFAGGPVPFDLSLTTKDKSKGLLSGNILIYPDSMDVKGSIFGNDAAVSDMLLLVKNKSEKVEDKTVRIDFNLKDWLQNHIDDDQG